ncbi:MAG TPA: flagellar hook-associated protein FlgK [Patescibacteria group bacterium]|nr:flagellar hook-associated protein FlgK [Patescibacteria group bacterium]
MASTFAGYNIAYTGMYVNQSALSVVSSNVSNVNTSGYSRKQITSEELALQLTEAETKNNSAGTGVDVSEVRRARDVLLDSSYRRQNSDYYYWAAREGNLVDAQETLSEFTSDDGTSDDGVEQTLTDFFDSWEELSKDPTSQSCRQSVIENAESLISTLQDIDNQLKQLQLDSAQSVKDSVDTLNDLASQVVELNQKIQLAEVSGVEASDLRDQRDLLVDQMSALTNVTTSEDSDGNYSVRIGGVALVSGLIVNTLTVNGDGTTESPLSIEWEGLNCTAEISSGSIYACMEDADQSGIDAITTFPFDFTGSAVSSISDLREGLNAIVSTIANAINSFQTSGYDLDGVAGVAFFTTTDGSSTITLQNIQVSDAMDDPDKVVTGSTTDSGDYTIAAAIYDWANEEAFSFDGETTDLNGFYTSLISWLSTTGDTASSSCDTQGALVQQIDTQRQSISSVSVDEEMSKMIMYQNAYGASARVLSTLDSLLEGIIQDLGGS